MFLCELTGLLRSVAVRLSSPARNACLQMYVVGLYARARRDGRSLARATAGGCMLLDDAVSR